MKLPVRLFMDVTYTRTQHVNVGITRTVRRLEEEFRALYPAGAGAFAAVAYHSGGFRALPSGMQTPVRPGTQRGGDRPAARLFRWITGAFFRKLVLAALILPWPILRFVWSTTSSWAFDFLSRADRAIDFGPGDVVLLFDASWNYPVWAAAAKARAKGAKVVVMMHDVMPLRHPEFCFALVPLIFRLWLDRMLPLADCVICNSHATEQDLRLHVRESGTALPPTSHFRLGSDPVRARTDDAAGRPALKRFLAGDSPCFAAVGSFEPKKNYGFLLEVFERLWARGLGMRLLIIGRESAECHDLIQRVRCHPQQGENLLALFDATDAEVALAYANCRALVFTSLAEGFGLPLVEARTRGALVIASSLPVFVELADAGVSIYAQGSHAALEELVIGHAGCDRRAEVPAMDPFTWGDSANQCLRVLQVLCAGEGAH
jgi:glycosyltransferase involved in cell wall biosynthesis